MPSTSTDPVVWGPLGPDPGRGIRVMIVLLLRMAIGLTLLNTGLAGYLNVQGMTAGVNPGIANVSFSGLEPLFTAIPYLGIGLGAALILGFLTTPASVAAGFFGLITPLLSTVSIISLGVTRGANTRFGVPGYDPFQFTSMILGGATYLPSLIPLIVLIWLSPVENNPYSLDALIFRRTDVVFETPTPATQPPSTPTADEPDLTIG